MLVPCFSVVTLTGAQMFFATISLHKRNVKLALLTLFPLWTPPLVLTTTTTTTTTIINLRQCGKHRAKLMTFSAKCCAFHHPSHPALQVCGAQWVGPQKWAGTNELNPDSCGLTITENTSYISVLCDVCGKLSLYTVAKCLLILNSLRNPTNGRSFSLYMWCSILYKMMAFWERNAFLMAQRKAKTSVQHNNLVSLLKQSHHSDKTKEVKVSDSSNIQKIEAQAYCK